MLAKDQRRTTEPAPEGGDERLAKRLVPAEPSAALDKKLAELAAKSDAEIKRLRTAARLYHPLYFWGTLLVLGGLAAFIATLLFLAPQPQWAFWTIFILPVITALLSLLLTRLQIDGPQHMDRLIEGQRSELAAGSLPRLLDADFQQQLLDAIAARLPFARPLLGGQKLADRIELVGRFYPALQRREMQPESITAGDCLGAMLQLVSGRLHNIVKHPAVSLSLAALLMLPLFLSPSRSLPWWTLAYLSHTLYLLSLPGTMHSAAFMHVVLEQWQKDEDELQPADAP